MNSEELREIGKKIIEYVADYWESIRDLNPLPSVEPDFIKELVPKTPPKDTEDWETIFADIDKIVLEGNTHWQHPLFFAFYPTGCSYQSIIGDVLSAGLASVGFSWQASPSMTELEQRMTDWVAKLLGLPEVFYNDSESSGGGIIQNTASDATFIAILAARGRAVERLKGIGKLEENGVNGVGVKENGACRSKDNTCDWILNDNIGAIYLPKYHDPKILDSLIAYCSDEAHSSVEKGAMLAGVRLRKIRTQKDGKYKNFQVTPESLIAAIQEDRKNNLIPFIFVATVGTTSTCGIDPIDELAPICKQENIWVHVDSAYAGSFMVCDEYKDLCKGVEMVDSFNTNLHKSMMINFDCSPMWFKNVEQAVKYFYVAPPYLKHKHEDKTTDYRHLQIALGRRFRSLKIWFTLRNLGIQKIQNYQRKIIDLAKLFEEKIIADEMFKLYVPRQLSLVCFRLKNGTDEDNEKLSKQITASKQIFLTDSKTHGETFLRFTVCSPKTTEEDVISAYNLIHKYATKILNSV